MKKGEKTQMIHINMENTVSADAIAAFRWRRFKVVAQNLVQDVEPFSGLLIRPALLVLIHNFLIVLFVPVLLRDMINFRFCRLRIYLAEDFYVLLRALELSLNFLCSADGQKSLDRLVCPFIAGSLHFFVLLCRAHHF